MPPFNIKMKYWILFIPFANNKPSADIKFISARIPEKLGAELEALAEATRRSKAFLVTEALQDYVHRQAWLVKRIDEAVREVVEQLRVGRLIAEAAEAPLEFRDAFLRGRDIQALLDGRRSQVVREALDACDHRHFL